MPTPGSIGGKKSSWPMPRMKTTAALLAPELPALVLKVRLGTDCATAEIFVAPFCSSAAPVIAVTATGVFCSDFRTAARCHHDVAYALAGCILHGRGGVGLTGIW